MREWQRVEATMEDPDIAFGVDVDADRLAPLAAVHLNWHLGPAFHEQVRIGERGGPVRLGLCSDAHKDHGRDAQEQRRLDSFHTRHRFLLQQNTSYTTAAQRAV